MRQKRGDANVVLMDPEKGWHLTYRENPPGEPLRFRGKFVHLCVQDAMTGELTAVDVPLKGLEGPERVYRARYWPEIRILFGQRQTLMEKLDKGLWLGALAILALLVFMLVSALL
jgi:hypothetical protein